MSKELNDKRLLSIHIVIKSYVTTNSFNMINVTSKGTNTNSWSSAEITVL